MADLGEGVDDSADEWAEAIVKLHQSNSLAFTNVSRNEVRMLGTW